MLFRSWWIITQLAQHMGFGEVFAYTKPAQIFREHARLSGFGNSGHGQARFPLPTPLPQVGEEATESLREFKIIRAFNISALSELDDVRYDALQPLQWPLNVQSPEGTQRLFGDGKFFTPNGKAHMVAVAPRLPAVATDTDFPLVLNTGRIRDQWHTMTRTGRVPRLNVHQFEPFVQVYAADAQMYQPCLSG